MDILKNNPDDELMFQVLSRISFVQYEYGNYDKSLEYALKSLAIAENLQKKDLIADAMRDIAYCNAEVKNYKKAISYGSKALQLAKEIKNQNLTGLILIDLGEIYRLSEDYGKAKEYMLKAISHYEKSTDKESFALTLTNFGFLYIQQKQFKEALPYTLKAYNLLNESKNTRKKIIASKQLGIIYREFGNYKEAENLLQEALLKAKSKKMYGILADIYHELALTSELKEDQKSALQYYKLHKAFNDTVYNETRVKQIADQQILHEIDKKDKENGYLKATIQNQNLYFILMGITVLSLILILYISFNSYNEKKKSNKIIQLQNNELTDKNIRLSELNEEKNNILGVVAHDMRAPLNRVAGLTELISQEPENLSDSQLQYLSLISKVVNDAREMVQGILDVKSIENKDFQPSNEPVNVDNLLNDLLTGFEKEANKKDIDIQISSDTGYHVIPSDKFLLERIFDNLISNAIKYSFPGTQVEINIRENKEKLRISIRDEGEGISEEEQKKLFQPFQKLSTRPTGGESSSGLGLSIVKSLVEALQGKVWCQSAPGKGSVFYVEMPLKSPKEKELIS